MWNSLNWVVISSEKNLILFSKFQYLVPEKIWQIQHLRTDDIPTWPVSLYDTNIKFYTPIGSFPHGAYLHTWRMLHTCRLVIIMVFTIC